MGTNYGYERVSTNKQELAAQTKALLAAGVARENIFSDKMSGTRNDRPGWLALLAKVQPGDVIIVTRSDRFSRSSGDMVSTVLKLRDRNIGFVSLSEPFDTTGPTGKFIFTIFAALAELDNDIRKQRIRDGLAVSTKKSGRPLKATSDRMAAVADLVAAGHSVTAACKTVGISRPAYYRAEAARNGRAA